MKLAVSEQDIEKFSFEHAKPGELPLVGVYAALRNLGKATIAGMLSATVAGSVAGGAVGGALGNKWCIFLANDKRIVIAKLGYVSTTPNEVVEVLREDIKSLKISKKLITYKIHIELNDGQKMTLQAGKSFVWGHKNHKQRMAQLITYLGVFAA